MKSLLLIAITLCLVQSGLTQTQTDGQPEAVLTTLHQLHGDSLNNHLDKKTLVVVLDYKLQVSSDRPTVGIGDYVLPKKKLQIETGGAYGSDVSGDFKTENLMINSTQLRYGITGNVELRASSNYAINTYTHEPTALSSEDNGLMPLTVGAKIRFNKNSNIDRKWNNFTLVANVNLNKLASDVYKTPHPGHDLTLVNTIIFSKDASLTSNVGMIWNGFDAGVTGLYTTAFSRKLTKRVTAIGELYGYWPEGAGLDVSFDGGFTYLFNGQLQGDVIGGFGISERAQDWFLGIGLCYLFTQ